MDYSPALPPELKDRLARLYRADEEQAVADLLPQAAFDPQLLRQAQDRAASWIGKIRAHKKALPGIAEMLSHFSLDTKEGIALMCLAEALLRIPDAATADALIRDKMTAADFEAHLGQDTPWTLRAASWALNLTGRISGAHEDGHGSASAMLGLLAGKLGHGAVREAIRMAMRWLGDQFVIGHDIDAAIMRANKISDARTRYSYDMLGEGARTAEDAERYYQSYLNAIDATASNNLLYPGHAPSGISVKLSALHPRYEAAQAERVYAELVPRLVALAEASARHDIFMVVDAEEADRLLLSLGVIEKTLETAKLGAWTGFGLAVQAYQKRAPAIIDAAAHFAQKFQRRMVVRLIKGAYWDTEIKRAQERGWDEFPVYTRKMTTDVSYLACARTLLAHGEWLTPVFGSHNALTIAAIIALAPDPKKIEFQCLFGMATELFELLRAEGYRTCFYSPVGGHDVLLGYLVRRLLENGANSSFINQLTDPRIDIAHLTADPAALLKAKEQKRHPAVILPKYIYAPERANSSGLDLTDPGVTEPLLAAMQEARKKEWPVPAAPPLDKVFSAAQAAFGTWHRRPVEERAAALNRLSGLLERDRAALMALLADEGGKTLPDALSEVREATDFCRYYAARARQDFTPEILPGPTGERNTLTLHGRGVFACISPWNFPLAIFLGQVAAALAAGNSVIAKPAPQTPRVAAHAVRLAHEAGIPADALQLLPGGADIGAALVAHPALAGVAFTGSVAAARRINRALAAKDGPIVPLIAETGGQNAIIIDSSALPEQVIDDVIASAFRSAGQRCSAARILCLPHATADSMIAALASAMKELVIGDPAALKTDIGPLIDHDARARLEKHVERLRAEAKEIFTLPLPEELRHSRRREAASGNPVCSNIDHAFFSPQIWEIPNVAFLTDEVFGPILHVVRYKPEDLPKLVAAINATGFGLTGGVHSRIDAVAGEIAEELHVGNLYVNRSIIGAVVGTQPFGGEGISGTGPKAGGPHYLPRFALERTVSINTTAAGGNATLLAAAGAD